MDYSKNYSNLTTTQSGMDSFAAIVLFVAFATIAIFAVFTIIAVWKIFTKAGRPGWATLIPFYNMVVVLQIIKRPVWWILLFFIPIVNTIIALIISLDLAKAFGRSAAFGLFLIFLFSPIGILMLGFGKSKYIYGAPTQTPPPSIPPTA